MPLLPHRAASGAIRLDDFRHGDAELLLDQYDFAAPNGGKSGRSQRPYEFD
jgi:hypothetical protein